MPVIKKNKNEWGRAGMIQLLATVFGLILSGTTFSQENRNINICVTQQMLPEGVSHTYKVENRMLKVYKHSRNGNQLLRCKRRFDKVQLDSIVDIAHEIISQDYDSIYFGGVLDGVNWRFKIQINGQKKTYVIDNYYLKPLEDLIFVLNDVLPSKKRYIRMDWFGLKRDALKREEKARFEKCDNVINKLPFQCSKHIFAPYGEYYYLQILPNGKYEMKIGMYGYQKVTGDYQIQDDTLTLVSHNYINDQFSIYDRNKKVVRQGLSKYEVLDSLLIPIEYKREIPLSRDMQRDSSIIAHFIQTNGHVNHQVIIREDSTFMYYTASDRYRHGFEGKWIRQGDILKMAPEDSDNLLYWSCTDNQMIFRENFLIGMRKDEETQQKEYHYFIELKPKIANMRVDQKSR